MSEVEEKDRSVFAGAPADGGERSAGELIREARERAGLHIAALAVSLKVPVKKLEALESGRFDLLPDAVFVRALASSVCRSLKIDAAPVLDRLPQTIAPKLSYQGMGVNAPFPAPSGGTGPSLWTQVSRPAILAGLAFLLAALVLIMLPVIQKTVAEAKADISLSSSPGSGNSVPATSVAPVEPAQVADNTSLAAASLGSAAPAVVPSSASVTMTALPVFPAGSTLQTAVPSPAIANASAPVQAAASGIVIFTAKSESWVEVTDARRTVVLRRILNAGEAVGASGALPLSVIVGRADATEVQIRGKAFDLSALARDNVARFEVK